MCLRHLITGEIKLARFVKDEKTYVHIKPLCNTTSTILLTVGAGIPNSFGIIMVALYLVFQWCSVLNKMATILSKKIGWSGMVAIAVTDHFKPKPLEIQT